MGAGNLCLGHHFQNLHFYVRVMMFWCVQFYQNTRYNIQWVMFISVESSSHTPKSILNASYSLFGCITGNAMVRYLNYYRLFINTRQCFIVTFPTDAHAQVNRLPIAVGCITCWGLRCRSSFCSEILIWVSWKCLKRVSNFFCSKEYLLYILPR